MYPEDNKDERHDLIQSFSQEASRERVEGLWKQAVSHRGSARSDLVAARASRTKAEMARQKIANEALEAAREACRQLITEAEHRLVAARRAEIEAQKRFAEAEEELKQAQMTRSEADSYCESANLSETEAQNRLAEAEEELKQAQMARSEADDYREKVMAEAQEELKQAQMARSEADSYRNKVMAEAQQEAQRICDEARSVALQECTELKRHVANEVQIILSEIDDIRAAAQEELEAQRIYAEVATIRAMSENVHSQVMEVVNDEMSELNDVGGYVSSKTMPEDVLSQIAAKVNHEISDWNSANGSVSPQENTGPWQVMDVRDGHSPEPMAVPEEVMANGQYHDGMLVDQMDDAAAPKGSKAGKGSSRPHLN